MHVDVDRRVTREEFRCVSSSPAFAESSALTARGSKPVEMLEAMAQVPGLLIAFGHVGDLLYPGGRLPRRLKEWVILAVSYCNDCQFCWKSHVDITKNLGICSSDPRFTIQQVHEGDPSPWLSGSERVAVEYAMKCVTMRGHVGVLAVERLKEHFTDSEVVELTAVVAFIIGLNTFNNALDVKYNGEYKRIYDPVGSVERV